MSLQIYIRGGGDLASGVATRLYRAGWRVMIAEIAQPLSVRRTVAFAEAVYAGRTTVEGITAMQAFSISEASRLMDAGVVAVLVDPQAVGVKVLRPDVLVDARMLKQTPDLEINVASLMIGLGPGFYAGKNCHAAIETKRGHTLGRVIWDGSPETDSGVPESVGVYQSERVLRSPLDGIVSKCLAIGSLVEKGTVVGLVGGEPVVATFTGVVRGIVHEGVYVTKGLKIGDIDPRCDPALCNMISDKALAVGGGVVEAILSTVSLREKLYG